MKRLAFGMFLAAACCSALADPVSIAAFAIASYVPAQYAFAVYLGAQAAAAAAVRRISRRRSKQ